jgi:hypothetical protein
LTIKAFALIMGSVTKGGKMSDLVADFDENLWQRYLDDLRTLSEENNGIKLFPSLSDFSVWLDNQDMDIDNESY